MYVCEEMKEGQKVEVETNDGNGHPAWRNLVLSR